MNERLRQELLAMQAHDLKVRSRLASDGSLFRGYHPQMEAVHRRHADRLSEIIDEVGWPGVSAAGEDGAEAAWLIVQHAIGEPALQRRCLSLLVAACERGEAPGWQAAFLDDRIRVFEGRKQRYGTQLDTGPQGEPVPFPIEDPEGVDQRRAALGLEPLAVRLSRAGRVPPMDEEERALRQREQEEWSRRVGWRR